MNKSLGFTLIELLVVAAITGVIGTITILNFQRSRIDLNLTSNEIIANLRLAQNKALASTKYNSGSGSKIRCGYGIHYINSTTYSMYVGPDASALDCLTLNRNYDLSGDTIVLTKSFSDSKIEFKSSFFDIFFEPPDPRTFINNNSSVAIPPQAITIGRVGTACPQDCRTINVYTTGKIQ